MQVAPVDEPGDQGCGLLGIPAPPALPDVLGPDGAGDDAGGAGQITMFASALPNPNLVLTISGAGIAAPVVMTPDTPNPIRFGRYLAHVPYTSLPASVLLDNSFDPVSVPPYPVPLVDEVTISQAVFNTQTRAMTIKATSRDRMAPLPTLTAVDFAVPNQFDATGTFTRTLTANPPTSVTVISSRGGTATAAVSVVTPPAAPVAVADAATTNFNTPVTVSVLANDTTAGSLDPASVQIAAQSADGLAECEPSEVGSLPADWERILLAASPPATHAKRKAPSVLERLDGRRDFQHRITHRRQCVVLVSLREQFRFHHAGPVCQCQELHRLAGDLMMRPLFDDQPAIRMPTTKTNSTAPLSRLLSPTRQACAVRFVYSSREA